MEELFLRQYLNGNAKVTIYEDGTRIIEAPDNNIQLDYPLNIDVRLSRRCAYGMNPKTSRAVCSFCHESATVDGKDASQDDIDAFMSALIGLPPGTEIAVGINQFSPEVLYFLQSCKHRGYIVNGTVNQGFLNRDREKILGVIYQELIYGLGISYRKGSPDIPKEFLNYNNTVVHVIAGIDSFDDVLALSNKGVKKLLVLGEKDFGFNENKVHTDSKSHREWFRRVHDLFSKFDVVSFDNLGLEQLAVKRFVKNWEEKYQHEFSFYADVVDRTFSPSSRSSEKSKFIPFKDYFCDTIRSLNSKGVNYGSIS